MPDKPLFGTPIPANAMPTTGSYAEMLDANHAVLTGIGVQLANISRSLERIAETVSGDFTIVSEKRVCDCDCDCSSADTPAESPDLLNRITETVLTGIVEMMTPYVMGKGRS